MTSETKQPSQLSIEEAVKLAYKKGYEAGHRDGFSLAYQLYKKKFKLTHGGKSEPKPKG